MLKGFRLLPLPALLLIGGGKAVAHDTLSCADHAITASAIRTKSDIKEFVRCAYEFVQEVGTSEARGAFNEDERWLHGQFYVFVDGIADSGEESVAYVFPPDPSREGLAWGPLVDNFGNDLVSEFHRVVTLYGSGWIYYSFSNPATGRAEPKGTCGARH